MIQTGLLTTEKSITGWRYKGFTPLAGKLDSKSNPYFWRRFLPLVERQIITYFDSFGCVIYSGLNTVEILHNYNKHKEVNYNDQYSAIFSNLRNYLGTSYQEFWSGVRNYGLLPQNDLLFTGKTWEEWTSKDNITPEMTKKALSFYDDFDIYREWVDESKPEDIFEALHEAPLQATVRFANGNGILSPKGKINHSIVIFEPDYKKCWYVFDTYTQSIKRYAWDYKFGAILKPSLIIKDNIMPQFKNNSLLQLVEGGGGFGLYIDGKLYIDSLDKILASFMVRNNGNTKGMAVPVTKADWDKLPKYNLKNKIIN